ncbi:MAG: hypothetical protein L0H29_00340 [Sinobacteraceae bacterium]|nr:hypothetical protein [Nevskiaceae bacterium]
MLRHGKAIRLTPPERETLSKLAHAAPAGVKTVDGYNRFIEQQQKLYTGQAASDKLLHHLLECEKIKD